MDHTPPTTKRRRAHSSPDRLDAMAQRGTPWFEDGTIIIHAQSTAFKVYRGMLAAKSVIFADMLSLPKPEPSSIKCEDLYVNECPVVRLSDSGEDWGYILDAVFNRRYTFTSDGTPLSCAITCSLLRLAHKYQFVDLLEDIMERLTRTFPSTLEGWDAANRRSFIKMDPESSADEYDLLSLAHSLGVHSILPALLYQCVNIGDCPLEPLLLGEKRKNERLVELDRADMKACIFGYRRIVELQADTTLAWISNDALYVGCFCWPNCFFSRQKVPLPAFCRGMPLVHLLDAWEDRWVSDMCRACAAAAKAAHEAGRREGWRQLPLLFGLPPWEALLANGESTVALLPIVLRLTV
ncbi:hypothetical protein HWV62_40860 [Athelia sp. TMB]|nr:hypothetical protein HWV62_40860 [Athelia sp. TMB]